MTTVVVRIILTNATQDVIRDTCDNQLVAGNGLAAMTVVGDSLILVFQPK